MRGCLYELEEEQDSDQEALAFGYDFVTDGADRGECGSEVKDEIGHDTGNDGNR